MCWYRSSPITLPLYRQAQIYARQGITLDRSTMADVGGTGGVPVAARAAGARMAARAGPRRAPRLAQGYRGRMAHDVSKRKIAISSIAKDA